MQRTRITTYDYMNNPILHFWIGYTSFKFLERSNINMFEVHTYCGIVAGWVMTDVLSYFLHMFIDSKFYDRYVANPSSQQEYALVDQHHTFPGNYSLMNANELVYMTYPMAVPILTCLFFYEHMQVHLSSFYVGFKLVLTILGLSTGYTHKWAHERVTNPFIKFLQNTNIILNAKHHRPHHIYHCSHYSLVNGSSQPLLDIFFAKPYQTT